MLYLRTFGGLSLVKDDALVTGAGAQRRRLAMLAVLAAAGDRGVSRDRLLVLFWPDVDEERARHALGQALYATRRDLGHDQLINGTTELRLDAGAIQSDVLDFAKAVARGDLRSAVNLHTGPFLDGFHMKDGGEFDRWLEEERSSRRREYVVALERLAADADARGDRVEAVDWWTRLAVADPLSARIACGLMNAHAAVGDRSAGLQHARVHQAYVRAELGVDPDPAVAALADRIATSSADAVGANALLLGTPPSIEAERADAATPRDTRRGEVAAKGDGRATRKSAFRRPLLALPLLIVAVLAVVDTPAAKEGFDPRGGRARERVVVARFDNVTGDSALAPYGQLVADWIADGLARTGIIDVVDPQSVRVSTRAADSSAVVGPAWIRAVAEFSGADLIVTGRVYRDHDGVAIRAQITHARDGTVLRSVDPVRGNASDPMLAAHELRMRVTGALATIIDPRLASLTTAASRPPTYEAYRTYAEGLDDFARQQYLPAYALFRRATRLDSTFSLPLFWAFHAAGNAGNSAARDSLFDVLRARRGEFPPAEQFAVDAISEARNGNRERELDAYRRAAELAPGSQWMYMRGLRARALGLNDEALGSFLAIDSHRGWARGWPWYWIALLESYHKAGRYVEELDASRRAQAEFPAMVHLKGREMVALAGLGRVDEVLSFLDSLALAPFDSLRAGPSPSEAYDVALLELAAHGHTAGTRRVAERCVAWYQRTGSGALVGPAGRSVSRINQRARCLTHNGLVDKARADYDEAIRLGASSQSAIEQVQGVRGYVGLGQLAAERGDTAETNRIIRLLPEKFAAADPYDGLALAHRNSAILAAILGDRDRAVTHLREAARIKGPIDDSREPALMKLRGYPPYDAMRQHLASDRPTVKQRIRAMFAVR